MSFTDLDAMVLDSAIDLLGDGTASIFAMKPGPRGVNGEIVADDSRDPLLDVPVIRAAWSERVEFGGQGMPMPAGKLVHAAAGQRCVVTLRPAGLAWLPRKNDEIVFAGEPGQRYRMSEPQPDGLSGLHIVLNRISA